ncbi:MAG: hypothetical protein M1829_003240 [Trizodia sp. TS-e1964]|nr:MAG: hypothetical protein M1829_003240 [Trizodia sp. TS-e1964]
MRQSSFLRAFTSLFTIPSATATPLLSAQSFLRSAFSSTSKALAKADLRKKGDKRLRLLRYHLYHPLNPRPLRLSRLRSLRHWTIHRAYLLHRRNLLNTQERSLEAQYNSIRAACEELRLLGNPSAAGGSKASPGTTVHDANGTVIDGARLYRVAMLKKGVFRPGGIPLEYARLQTDGPPRAGWNHEWKR